MVIAHDADTPWPFCEVVCKPYLCVYFCMCLHVRVCMPVGKWAGGNVLVLPFMLPPMGEEYIGK